MVPSVFSAEVPTQFLLIDTEDVWTTTRIYRGEDGDLETQPESWGDPIDYQNGTLHLRLEILDKPSDAEVMSMLCLWQDGNEICTRFDSEASMRFAKEGVYYEIQPAPGEGDDVEGNVVWRRPTGSHTGNAFFKPTGNCDWILLQWWIKDAEGEWKVLRHNPENGVHAKLDYGEGVNAHIPIRFRLEMYVVAKGAVFDAPKHWASKP